MNLLKSKITKRYLIIRLLVTFFALFILFILTTYVMNSSFQEEIEYRNNLFTRTLSKRIDYIIKGMVSDMRVVSSYVLKETEEEQRFYLKEMQKVVVNEPLYLFIQAFNKDGDFLIRVPEVNLSSQLKIEDIKNRLSWSKAYYISNLVTLPDGRKTIAIAYPALNEQGEYQGGVIAFVNLRILSSYLKELKIGEYGINALIDRNGLIIGHNDTALISSSLKEHTIGINLLKERNGIWEGEFFGKKMIVVYRPLPRDNFGLLVAEPKEQAMLPARNVTSLLLKGFIAVLLITLSLTAISISRLVKPILYLIQQVKEYKEDRRKNIEPVKTNNELEDLSLIMGQMAKELTDKEKRLFYILESIPYGVITTNKNGRITTFNKGAEELTLFKRKEVIDKYIFELPLKEDKENFFSWKIIKEGKEFDEVESYVYDRNKKKHDVKIYSSLFFEEDKKLVGSIFVIRDVSEVKKLEEYLMQSEKLSSLGQLTAGIAHEIKNPLSIIQAAAEAIQLEILESKSKNFYLQDLTEDILESSDRMNSLLTDFLKMSKDNEEDIKENVDITNLLDELVALLRKKLEDQDIIVYYEYEVDTAFTRINKNKITQVFLNILLNSIQAMENGGKLFIRVKDNINNWKIEIEDTGKGIPANKIKRIFNPFFSTKREGTGLGLSIAHEIIIQHNGKIRARSEEGKGTTLSVEIPNYIGGE